MSRAKYSSGQLSTHSTLKSIYDELNTAYHGMGWSKLKRDDLIQTVLHCIHEGYIAKGFFSDERTTRFDAGEVDYLVVDKVREHFGPKSKSKATPKSKAAAAAKVTASSRSRRSPSRSPSPSPSGSRYSSGRSRGSADTRDTVTMTVAEHAALINQIQELCFENNRLATAAAASSRRR